MLETWHRAFPNAISVQTEILSQTELPVQVLIAPVCVWLRLSSDMTVAMQVAATRTRFPHSHLLILSDMPNDLEALAAFSVAARAYCNSHAGEEVLHSVANVVQQGGLWIGESIMQRLLNLPPAQSASNVTSDLVSNSVSNSIFNHQLRQQPAASPLSADAAGWDQRLTEREREVACAIAAGASNRDIAGTLQITERTVKAHVSAILEKLQIKSRLQLAVIVKNR